MKPKKAEAKTVAAVPITVLATETVAARGNPLAVTLDYSFQNGSLVEKANLA